MAKIERGATHVELVNEKTLVRLSLPSFLTNLHGLQCLHVNRVGNPLVNHSRALTILKGLVSTLKSLTLHFDHSTALFMELCSVAGPSSEESDLKVSVDEISERLEYQCPFHQLEVLDLDASETMPIEPLNALPPTLLSLSNQINGTCNQLKEFSASLPRSVTHIRLLSHSFFDVGFFENLPLSLRTLILHAGDYTPSLHHIAKMPRSVTNIAWDGPVIVWTPSAAEAFPRGLEDLSIVRIQGNAELPRYLTRLEVFDQRFNAPMIRRLPRSLTKLQCQIDWTDLGKDDMPPSLLALQSMRPHLSIAQTQVGFLPSTLKEIYLFGIDYADIGDLPSGLTSATLGIKVPTNRENTSVAFPRNLKTLSMILAPYSIFFDLPRSLTNLICLKFYGDVVFDPTDPKVIQHEAQFGSPTNGSSTSAEMTRLGLLPRSLRFLEMPKYDTSNIGEISPLPGSLTSLVLGSVPEGSMALLTHIKLRCLELTLPKVTNRHFELMPRTIERYTLRNSDYSALTPEVASMVPFHATASSFPFREDGPPFSGYSTRPSAPEAVCRAYLSVVRERQSKLLGEA